MPSKQRQTIDTLVNAFNKLDIDTIVSLRTPSCTRVFLPSSLNLKPQTNEVYLAELQRLKPIFTSFELTVNDVIEDLDARKIVLFVSALGQTVVGEYNNEYVWRIGFDESGEKISEWTEYVDAGTFRDFYPKLAAALKSKAAEEQGQK
jgi:hypothetical protein